MKPLNPNNKGDLYLALIIGQMAEAGVYDATILFFRNIFPSISEPGAYLKRKEMAAKAVMSTQAAGVHIDRLARLGYLVRYSRTRWRLSDTPLTHPVYAYLARGI